MLVSAGGTFQGSRFSGLCLVLSLLNLIIYAEFGDHKSLWMKEKVREQFFPQQAQLCMIGCKLDFRKAKLLGLKKLVIFGR